jgi:enoyl-CoA hydratase/carnithine racemase
MRRENPAFAWLGNQPDAREGVLSFVEKRKPNWTLTPSDVPKELIK